MATSGWIKRSKDEKIKKQNKFKYNLNTKTIFNNRTNDNLEQFFFFFFESINIKTID